MEKILFEDATLTKQAKITIDGVDHLVTEAEYSGGTDLNANTFNQLQDNVENAIDEVKDKHNYSTEEQIIGTWIDGKPIYRIVKQVNKISGSLLDIPLDDVETMIRIYGNLISDGGIVYGDLMRYETETIYTKAIYYPEYGKAMFISGTDPTCNGLANIVFEYTKTID